MPPPDPDRTAPQAEIADWVAVYGPGLRAFFIKRAGIEEAEDLMQEVFLRLQTRGRAERIDNVEGYLFKVAQNVLTSRGRYKGARGRALQVPLHPGNEPIDEASPERILMGKLDYARVIVAIGKLPPRCQIAFMFHRFEEMTYPMIAQRMGISLDAVRALMSRALSRLAAELEQTP